jgi:pimeloyl-ACP methyl ester carboxylesterase
MATPFGDVRNPRGERLDLTYVPAAGGDPAAPPARAVVIGHGITGHKDRPWLVDLSDALAASGLPAVRMSFSGHGASEGRFEDAVPFKEVLDLGAVLDALERWGVRTLAYVGHSMGGAVGVLRAAVDPRIACLVSLAGMVHVEAFFRVQFGHLPPGAPVLGNPDCPWSPAMLEAAARTASVTEQAATIRIPWLIVHGDADEIVPYQDSLDAHAAAGGRPDLVTLPGVDHRFTGAIPQMVGPVVGWIRHRLSANR